MFLTSHAAVGVLVAQQTTNPWVAFFGSFLSHFILDFVPHGDEGIDEWLRERKRRMAFVVLLDVTGIGILTLALVNVVALPAFGLVTIGIIGSVLPDVLAVAIPVVRESLARNWFVRVVDWFHRKLLLAPFFRTHKAFHEWIHNPWHDLLPIKVSQEIGILVQVFILLVFFVTEITLLGK